MEFPTAMDLLESGFRGEVNVTKTYKVDPELKGDMDNIYEFDIVKLSRENRQSLKGMRQQGAEFNTVQLMREASKKKKKPGLISVPYDAHANFVAQPPSTNDHTLNEIIENNWIGYNVTFNSPHIGGFTYEDYLLVQESPFRIIGSCRYSATSFTELHPETGDAVVTKELPEYDNLKVRQLLSGLPSERAAVSMVPSQSSIIQLTKETFDEIAQTVRYHAYEDVDMYRPGPRKPGPKPAVPSKPDVSKPVVNRDQNAQRPSRRERSKSETVIDTNRLSLPPPETAPKPRRIYRKLSLASRPETTQNIG